MFTRSSDRKLTHKYWIKANENMCLKGMGGGCDKLGQDPTNYTGAMKVISVYEFLYPVIVMLLWSVYIAQLLFSTIVIVFSVVFIPLYPLVLGMGAIAFIVTLVIGIVVDILFLYYLFKQVGVYAIIPVLAFIAQLLLGLIPVVGGLLSLFVGVIPWGLMAVGAHYIHYQVGIGIVFNADDACYIKNTDKGLNLDW